MYVKVRTMDGCQTFVLTISKLTSVSEFRILVQEKFDVTPDRQRLFYRGKQMEDGHNMFDYNVNINDVIQLLIKPVLTELTNKDDSSGKCTKEVHKHEDRISNDSSNAFEGFISVKQSLFYEVGDYVDAQSPYDGAWWEAKITKISPNPNTKKVTAADDGLLYSVVYDSYLEIPEDEVKLECIRPRARRKASFNSLRSGHIIMVNYNTGDPKERGFWYDYKVKNIVNTRSSKHLIGTIFINNNNSLEDCHIYLIQEIFKIEKHILVSDKLSSSNENVPAQRLNGVNCTACKDNKRKKCKECGCHTCGGKENPEKQLMCDECDQPFHIYCLDPPLESIPEDDQWFCPLCKNDDGEIVKAGEKLKMSKKKSKMASAKSNASRDWGKGFACASRQKICDIVSQNHFGPIPGVEIGSLWKYRLQVSEAGIHRPHVAGIHGRENEGAYSIVLAGGYEDDEDRGDEFTYTGSGGRDLSGNKRTAEQSSDQLLTRMNKALALNCNAVVNKKGAEAKDWRGGKPVRVVRNYKGRKHSDFAPEEGNRYDGIYKIVKYWQASGKSGFKVWRYLLRRDDDTPAPWTKEGKKKIMKLGLTLKFPEGYEEAMKEKDKGKSFVVSDADEESEPKKRGKKRKVKESINSPVAKKPKTCAYEIQNELTELIENDPKNFKLWEECTEAAKDGKIKFLSVVEDRFLCMCCQTLVHNPVTTDCKHNVCKDCLRRSFKADVHTCPSCRHDLGKEYPMTVNVILRTSLSLLFPGYERGR